MHLACFMPFDKVAEMMEELLSVQTTEETVRRHTEQAGAWMEDWQAVVQFGQFLGRCSLLQADKRYRQLREGLKVVEWDITETKKTLARAAAPINCHAEALQAFELLTPMSNQVRIGTEIWDWDRYRLDGCLEQSRKR